MLDYKGTQDGAVNIIKLYSDPKNGTIFVRLNFTKY